MRILPQVEALIDRVGQLRQSCCPYRLLRALEKLLPDYRPRDYSHFSAPPSPRPSDSNLCYW